MPLQNLPPKVLLKIASHLSQPTLTSLLLTNKHLYSLLLPLRHLFALQPKDSLPALIWASKHNHLPLIHFLLSKSTPINTLGPNSKTALHHAAKRGHENIVALLLQRGANARAWHVTTGVTPLHYSAAIGHRTIIQMLLAHGAEIEAVDIDGWTPLHWAVDSRSIMGPWILEQLGVRSVWNLEKVVRAEFWETVEVRAVNAARLLLESGADVQSCRDLGETVLHRAALRGAVGMVKLLLEKGANMEAVNRFRVTPLLLAKRANPGLRMVELMMEWKASLEARDDEDGGVLLPTAVHIEQV